VQTEIVSRQDSIINTMEHELLSSSVDADLPEFTAVNIQRSRSFHKHEIDSVTCQRARLRK